MYITNMSDRHIERVTAQMWWVSVMLEAFMSLMLEAFMSVMLQGFHVSYLSGPASPLVSVALYYTIAHQYVINAYVMS